MFGNIELPLGYNIMTLEYVLERTWKEIAKNIHVKKWQNPANQALFGALLLQLVHKPLDDPLPKCGERGLSFGRLSNALPKEILQIRCSA